MAIDPVSPVRAPVPLVSADRPYDAGKRAEGVEAFPAHPRAALATRLKLWRSYGKGGVKKRYVAPQRKKTAREQVDAFLQSANGAQLVAESKIDDARSRERRERRDRVDGAAGAWTGAYHGPNMDSQPVEARENRVRRANAHRLGLERAGVSATHRKASRSAADHARDADAASHDGLPGGARLAEARETVRGLPIDVVDKARNTPLDRIPDTTGIQGLPAEDIQNLCAAVFQEWIGMPLGMAQAIAEPRPDEKKALLAFDSLVNYAAQQNDRGVQPRAAIAKGLERADTPTLIATAFSIVTSWSAPGRGGFASVS